MVPDITMRGQDDPHGRALVRRPPTVGQLAARIHALSASPGDWWHLVRFETGPVRVPLEEADGVRLWLITWPPGHRTDVHDHEVSTLIAGELAEVRITPDGVVRRPLRANRVRVHGGGRTHELTNPGPAYAITLHGGLACG
ncbi:cysteine dioxygenase family protein [Actinomadura vinacea]|uniref:Cysteine dioxygenase family protein n=1 Tax=Actinomadura vinacea TaxID=115336 RepID=A0ABN3KA57_9ACTN